MLSPDYYLHCTDALTDLIGAYDDAVTADIARRIVKTGHITDTAKMQIKQAQEMGLLYDDVMQKIAEHTDATSNAVRALFEDAGIKSVDYDNRIYRMAGLDPTELRASPTMLQVLQAGFDATNGTFKNLTLTTANTAQQAYISACDLAMLQVQSGAMSYQEAIRAAINKVAADGTYVLYPSGRSDRIEVAIRRAVLTGVARTCRTIGEYNAASVGSDLMELSAHAGARPSHAAWQGKIVSLSGKKGYLSKADIGYGTADGFGGINCRHDWYPFFPGISQRNYTDKDIKRLDDMTVTYDGQTMSYYDATQLQRKMERDIRESKRKLSAIDAARKASNDDDLRSRLNYDYQNESVKIKQSRDAIAEFSAQTGLADDSFRTTTYGFGRSQSSKSRAAYNSVLTSWKSNDIIGITTNAVGNRVYDVKRTVITGGPSDGVTQFRNIKGGVDRNYYDADGKQTKQISNTDHGHKSESEFGKHGEHAHDYTHNSDGSVLRPIRELTDIERKENGDIL